MNWRSFLVLNSFICVASTATLVIRNGNGPVMHSGSSGDIQKFQLNLPLSISEGIGKILGVLNNAEPITIQIKTTHDNPSNMYVYQKPNHNSYEDNPLALIFGGGSSSKAHSQPNIYYYNGRDKYSQYGRPHKGHSMQNYYPYYYIGQVGQNPYLKAYDEQNTSVEQYYRDPMKHVPGGSKKQNTHTNIPNFTDQPNYGNMNINLSNQKRLREQYERDASNVVGYIDNFPVILLNENEIR